MVKRTVQVHGNEPEPVLYDENRGEASTRTFLRTVDKIFNVLRLSHPATTGEPLYSSCCLALVLE